MTCLPRICLALCPWDMHPLAQHFYSALALKLESLCPLLTKPSPQTRKKKKHLNIWCHSVSPPPVASHRTKLSAREICNLLSVTQLVNGMDGTQVSVCDPNHYFPETN